jgi:hypothetical protein
MLDWTGIKRQLERTTAFQSHKQRVAITGGDATRNVALRLTPSSRASLRVAIVAGVISCKSMHDNRVNSTQKRRQKRGLYEDQVADWIPGVVERVLGSGDATREAESDFASSKVRIDRFRRSMCVAGRRQGGSAAQGCPP